MKISIAQIHPIKGDIPANIEKHKAFIELALSFNSNALFFPELSLTGYEPELAKNLALKQDDHSLDIFQKLSDDKIITLGLGIPTKTKTGVRINMVVFQPKQQRQNYSKQLLHEDELPYFEAGETQLILAVDNKKIAPAICYESLQAVHSDNANKLGADIYLASVAKSQNGMNKTMAYFPVIAKKYSMPVFMCNAIGYCHNFLCAGQSSIWTKEGKLAGQLDSKNEGILIFDTETEELIKL